MRARCGAGVLLAKHHLTVMPCSQAGMQAASLVSACSVWCISCANMPRLCGLTASACTATVA